MINRLSLHFGLILLASIFGFFFYLGPIMLVGVPGGFLLGIVSSMFLLKPYYIFGEIGSERRLNMLFSAIPLLCLLLLMAFVIVFNQVSAHDFEGAIQFRIMAALEWIFFGLFGTSVGLAAGFLFTFARRRIT